MQVRKPCSIQFGTLLNRQLLNLQTGGFTYNINMKKANKQLSRKVLDALNKDPNFAEAYQMVCNRAKTKPYLVGGKLYRTMIEIIYDYPARSHSCDFDFAAETVRKRKKEELYTGKLKTITDLMGNVIEVPVKRARPRKSSYLKGDSVKLRTRHGCKIDLMNIPDLHGIKTGKLSPTIEGYLEAVPLSVQSIAMDIDKCEIFGRVGLDSINEKFIWINNKEVLTEYVALKGWTIDRYVRSKADSIKFFCDRKVAPKPVVAKLKYKKNPFFNTAANNAPVFFTTTTATGGWVTNTTITT